jgi:histidine triad (HIT) family protein
MDDNCLFCKIVAGKIPSQPVFSDDQVVVFRDIHPKARVHLLVVPRIHLASLAEADSKHAPLLGHMLGLLPGLAHAQGLENGFRTIINTGPGGGQEIMHLHIHLLGGGQLPGF